MGKRGPKPSPTATLKLRGSWRGQTRQGEPEPEVVIPPCPSWVSKDAQGMWQPLAEQLAGLSIMADVHSPALALLIDSLARYIRLRDEVEQTGYTTTTDKGNEIQHPLVSAMNRAWDQVLKALREFGMTPSAMTGVRAVAPEKSAPTQKGLSEFKLG